MNLLHIGRWRHLLLLLIHFISTSIILHLLLLLCISHTICKKCHLKWGSFWIKLRQFICRIKGRGWCSILQETPTIRLLWLLVILTTIELSFLGWGIWETRWMKQWCLRLHMRWHHLRFRHFRYHVTIYAHKIKLLIHLEELLLIKLLLLLLSIHIHVTIHWWGAVKIVACIWWGEHALLGTRVLIQRLLLYSRPDLRI